MVIISFVQYIFYTFSGVMNFKKYSVGENAGMKLDADGGLKIYVSAVKPKDVPSDNWLPINRNDQGIDIILRIYAPDLEKMKTWKAPKAMKIEQ